MKRQRQEIAGLRPGDAVLITRVGSGEPPLIAVVDERNGEFITTSRGSVHDANGVYIPQFRANEKRHLPEYHLISVPKDEDEQAVRRELLLRRADEATQLFNLKAMSVDQLERIVRVSEMEPAQ